MKNYTSSRNVIALNSLKNINIGPAYFKKNLKNIKGMAGLEDAYDAVMALVIAKNVSPRKVWNVPSRQEWGAELDRADKVLERCIEVGIEVITVIESDYPAKVLEISKPPPVLFLRGNRGVEGRKTIGIIGTRKPTKVGEIIAARMGSYFAENGFSLCNGLADGVDWISVSSAGTCREGAVGVMGGGLDLLEARLGPRAIAERAEKLLEAGGLLVSEAMPGTREDPYSIMASCRIQAALSDALVLVQSSMTGGSRFAVAAFCGLPRLLAFVVPPEQERGSEEFAANVLMAEQEESGLMMFAQRKDAGKARLLAIRSRDDYGTLLNSLGGRDDALL